MYALAGGVWPVRKKLRFGLRPVVSATGQKPCPKNCGTKEVACAVKCVPVVGG